MKQFFFLLLTAATMLLGCDKSYEKFDPNPSSTNDTTWANVSLSTLQVADLYQDLQIAPFIDSVSAVIGGVINFPNYSSITIPPNAFTLNGGPLADGKATIRFSLITQKGDMTRMCLPTQSNGYLLESGGEIYLDASKYGKQLALAPGKQITINYKSINQPSALMKGFVGAMPMSITGPNSCFNWIPVPDTDVKVSTTGSGYQVTTNVLHWINCDYFNDSSSAKTTVALTMPINFTNANTYTFIVYKNMNGVMQFDADAINRIWVKNNVPLNKPVIFISITKRGGDYYLGTAETTTTTNQHIVLKPNKQKLQDILNYLASL